MDKSNERTTNKRRKILDNSIKLFVDNDIKKVTMDDIAKLSNVSKMTVYKYFSDKESLYNYVGVAVIESCYNALIGLLDSDINVIQKMIGVTSVLVDFITQEHLSLCIELGALNNDVNIEIEQFNTNIKEIIISLIKEGKKNKLIYEDISDECIYHYIDMGLNYFQHNLEYREKIMSDSSFRRDYMTFIWSNIFIDHSQFKC